VFKLSLSNILSFSLYNSLKPSLSRKKRDIMVIPKPKGKLPEMMVLNSIYKIYIHKKKGKINK